jgi:2-dehydropantoate 2-reductase
MRIGVIGAGAVGGAVAALLARAGHDVEVTARGENLRAIGEHGLRLSGGWGDFAAPVSVAETLTLAPEIAFVATKAQDAAAAIAANADLLGGIPVAVVQNGLGSVSATEPLLPTSSVVGALAMYASSLTAPGQIAITTAGHTYLGGGDPAAARLVSALLGEVMPASVADNFVGAQWTKLIVNQVNALPAITGLSVQEVVAIRELRGILTESMRENVRVAHRSGVRFADLQGLTDGRLRLFSRAPLAVAAALPRLLARRMGAIPNPGSTLQSIRRGSLTEIDHLNGAVVAAGARVGVPTPVNAALVGLVHEVERTRIFLQPNEVAERVSRSR